MQMGHIASFIDARKHLVDRRSALIKALNFGGQSEQIEAHIDLVVRIQSAIDVIDRAIEEERLDTGAAAAIHADSASMSGVSSVRHT